MSEITEIAAKARSLSRNTHDGIAIEEYLLRHLPALSSAAVAEREPVAFTSQGQLAAVAIGSVGAIFRERSDALTVPLYLDPPPVSELEAENARLRAELECALIREANEKHRANIAHQNMNAEINARERSEARLAEALKPFANLANSYDGIPPRKYFGDTNGELRYYDDHKTLVEIGLLRAARRVREGGKVDG